MAEIVNLRKTRKARARAAAEGQAAANRTRFGRSRAERDAQAEEAARGAKVLDGHRRDDPDGAA